MTLHISLADQYQAGDSFWHRANPKVKLAIILAFILAVNLHPIEAWTGLALLAGLLWLAAFQARVSMRWLLKRSLLALPFVLAAFALPFTTPGQIVARLPPFDWPISVEGTVRLAAVLVKSWLSVQAALVLVRTTPFHEMLWGLRGLGLPRLLVAVVALMYRYLFVLADEAGRLLRARASRSAQLPGVKRPGLGWQARVAGHMVGVLFVRALERSDRIYAAMLARGYRGEIQVLEPPAWRAEDTILVLGAALALAAVLLLERLG